MENINLPKLSEHPGDIARKYDHLRHFNMPTLDNLQVTVLIGQDNINLISPVRVEQGPSSAPSASLCRLGWTISGPHTVLDDSKTQHSMHQTALFCSNCLKQDNDHNQEVSHWSKTETIPLESNTKSNDPEVLSATKILNTTCVRQADGRYETILQPTRTTGKNSQRQRLKFHQYSKDLPGKQLHNNRDTEICGIERLNGTLFHREHQILVEHGNASLG